MPKPGIKAERESVRKSSYRRQAQSLTAAK